ncbi:MAG: hypothetical protein CEE40_07310 [Chloroflexi bacterium B3_Chlor]|nr:MAG: hypothetical protein CEE40_07310 [Chloroflexi bacterium B3_Chlor]
MGNVVLRTRQECEDFVRGLCFRGAGGGGRPAGGLRLLLDQLEAGREIEWVDLDSLADDAWTVTVAGMGGRASEGGTEEDLAALGCVEEKYDALGLAVAAVRALEEAEGAKVEAIVPGETGGSAVPAAIAAALELGVPVADADYAGGRAIPEVPQAIPELRGVPVCPMSFVTRWGDVLILKDTVSTAMADRIGRMITLASYGGIGFSWYLLQVKDVKRVVALDTLSNALHVGKVISEARETGVDPVAEATRAVDGWLLFEGELTATEVEDEQAYAFGLGTHRLKGVGSHEGHTVSIWYKNEYHVSWMDDKPFVTSPDSLIMVDLKTGEPAISYDFFVGDQVAVIGRGAHEAHRSAEGIQALGPRHFGFDLDYVPIEERVKEFGL